MSAVGRQAMPILFAPEEWVTYFEERRVGRRMPSYEAIRHAALCLGSSNGPALLHDLYCADLLSESAARRAAFDAWAMCEFPMHFVDRDMWRFLFTHGGYARNGRKAERPTRPLRLWRGCQEGYEDRWSWTSDRRVAEKYARGMLRRPPGQLWTAEVDPRDLLAHITFRREAEYVVDTGDCGEWISPERVA